MKRILISCAALLILTSVLFGCSAYNNPGKYITVPEKGSATISRANIDENVQEYIDELLEDGRESVYVEAPDGATVEMGDKADIFYTGTPVRSDLGLTDDDLAKMTNVGGDVYGLVIGSNEFVKAYESDDESKNNKGFEEQLIGAKKGDKVTVTVTFPDTYTNNEKLEGQVVNFDVEIQSIEKNVVDDTKNVEVSYSFDQVFTIASDDDNDGIAPAFEDKFKSGTFTVDYTDPDSFADTKFNDIFSVKDYTDELKGKSAYSTVQVTATVPEGNEDYASFAGQEIVINFEINEITTLPELNDEYVANNTDYASVSEYKEALEKSIIQSYAYTAIVDATVVNSYPKSELKKAYKNAVDNLVYQKIGAAPSSFSQSELNEKISADDYAEIYAQASATAYGNVKERLVLEYLIDYFDIKLTNKEYKEKLEEYYNTNGYYLYYYYGVTSVSAMEKTLGKDVLKLQFKSDMLNEHLADYITITE